MVCINPFTFPTKPSRASFAKQNVCFVQCFDVTSTVDEIDKKVNFVCLKSATGDGLDRYIY